MEVDGETITMKEQETGEMEVEEEEITEDGEATTAVDAVEIMEDGVETIMEEDAEETTEDGEITTTTEEDVEATMEDGEITIMEVAAEETTEEDVVETKEDAEVTQEATENASLTTFSDHSSDKLSIPDCPHSIVYSMYLTIFVIKLIKSNFNY